jgi:hypothetical protein
MTGHAPAIVGLATAALIAGGTTFFVVRENTHGERALAESTAVPTQTPIATTTSGSPTPIPTSAEHPGLREPTSFGPGWDEPYREAYWANPQYDQTINGINVGPSVQPEDLQHCPRGTGTLVDRKQAAGLPVSIEPTYLPPDAIENGEPRLIPVLSQAMACNDEVVWVEAGYGRKAAPDAQARLADGESWFDIPTGGVITIFRSSIRGPNVIASLPAKYWEGATVNGLPAVVGNPILSRGLGDAYVATWDAESGVLTIVAGLNMTVEEVTRILEGLQ